MSPAPTSPRAGLPLAALAALTLGVTGCSDGTGRGAVRGKVTFNGRPVTGAVIAFENPAGGAGGTDNLAADGSYEIKSYQGAGLPAGTYRVAIRPGGTLHPQDAPVLVGKRPPRQPPPPSVNIPQKYRQSATSGLSVEVKEGGNPPFNFDLKK